MNAQGIDPTLAPLFLSRGSQYGVNLGIQSAVLVAWNATTGANTVALRGTNWNNCPRLSGISLTTGPVLVAVAPTGPIIIGNIVGAA